MEVNIDMKQARYALIGDGYLKEEVLKMSDEKISQIWADRFRLQIMDNFYKGIRIGLYDGKEVRD